MFVICLHLILFHIQAFAYLLNSGKQCKTYITTGRYLKGQTALRLGTYFFTSLSSSSIFDFIERAIFPTSSTSFSIRFLIATALQYQSWRLRFRCQKYSSQGIKFYRAIRNSSGGRGEFNYKSWCQDNNLTQNSLPFIAAALVTAFDSSWASYSWMMVKLSEFKS